MHLQAVLHFRFAATHGHLLPLVCSGVSEQDFTLVFLFLPQLQDLDSSASASVIVNTFSMPVSEGKWLFGQIRKQRSTPLSSPKLNLVRLQKLNSTPYNLYFDFLFDISLRKIKTFLWMYFCPNTNLKQAVQYIMYSP